MLLSFLKPLSSNDLENVANRCLFEEEEISKSSIEKDVQ